MAVEEVTDENSHAVAQLQVLAHSSTTQVEIAVFHAEVVAAVGIVFDGERGRGRRAQHGELTDNDFDVAGIHLGVLALTLAHGAFHLDAVFAAQFVGLVAEGFVVGFVEHKLRDAIPVAQVDKGHAAHLAGALHPSCQRHVFSFIREPQLPTGICSIHIYKYDDIIMTQNYYFFAKAGKNKCQT